MLIKNVIVMKLFNFIFNILHNYLSCLLKENGSTSEFSWSVKVVKNLIKRGSAAIFINFGG